MRQLLFLLLLLSSFSLFSQASKFGKDSLTQLRVKSQNAYSVGEKLHYGIRYGIIEAGVAEISVVSIVSKRGRPSYHVVGTGRSIGMAEWFFKTRDRYESFIDVATLAPWEFIRDVNEGGHIIKRHLIFDQFQKQVYDRSAPDKGRFDLPGYAQDMISAFYYARSYDTQGWQEGQLLQFNMFLDYEQFPFVLRYLGKETIKTEFGRIRCLKLRPTLQKGRVFKDEEDMTIWVTDDKNKVPVLIQSNLLVGSIKVELKDYEGLSHPLEQL
jgi:hypothetical protein